MTRSDRYARNVVAALVVFTLLYLGWHLTRAALPPEPDYPRFAATDPGVELIPPMSWVQTTTTTTAAPTTTAVPERNVWDRIADCESGEWDEFGVPIAGTARWDHRTETYEGGLHWLNDTWLRAGGGRYAQHAYDATREQQIEIAQAWLARTSWDQWPVCSYKAGAR